MNTKPAHQIAAAIEDRRDDVTAIAYEMVDGTTRLYLTRRALQTCGQCDQPLGHGRPGPLTWVDRGEEMGTHSHQHGCGMWNPPTEGVATLPPEAEPDDPGHDAQWSADQHRETLEDEAIRALAQLDAEVDQERGAALHDLRASLHQQLTYAMRELSRGTDPEDVTTGSEMEPGVFRDGDEWIAWDFEPWLLPDPDEGADSIIVTESDL